MKYLILVLFLSGCVDAVDHAPCRWESGHTIQAIEACDFIRFCMVEVEFGQYGYAWFPRMYRVQDVCIRNHFEAEEN